MDVRGYAMRFLAARRGALAPGHAGYCPVQRKCAAGADREPTSRHRVELLPGSMAQRQLSRTGAGKQIRLVKFFYYSTPVFVRRLMPAGGTPVQAYVCRCESNCSSR